MCGRMRRLHIYLLLLVVLTVSPAIHVHGAVEEIRDYYQTGTCSCITNGQYSSYHGAIILYQPGMEEYFGYIIYNSSLGQVEEVTVTTRLILDLLGNGGGTPIAIWISETLSMFYTEYYDLMKDTPIAMRGVVVALIGNEASGYIEYVVGIGDAWHSNTIMVLSHGTVGYTAECTVTIHLSKLTNNSMYIEVYIGDSRVYISDKPHKTIPLYNTRYIHIASGGYGTSTTAARYTLITFNSESSRYISIPPIEMAMLVLTPSVGVYMHNSTHLIVSYVCFYRDSVDECDAYTVRLYNNETGDSIAEVGIYTPYLREPVPNIAMYREYISVQGVGVVRVVLLNSTGAIVAEGMIRMPEISVGQSPYIQFVFTMIPVSIVVALVVKTQSMVSVGIGLIGSGVIVLLLPWIGISFSGIYALALLLLMLGIVVLTMYR